MNDYMESTVDCIFMTSIGSELVVTVFVGVCELMAVGYGVSLLEDFSGVLVRVIFQNIAR